MPLATGSAAPAKTIGIARVFRWTAVHHRGMLYDLYRTRFGEHTQLRIGPLGNAVRISWHQICRGDRAAARGAERVPACAKL
jgi:hypothetical protein